jgi:hypothetical protein
MLVLLQTLVDSGIDMTSLQKVSVQLVKDCLIPNMVWSAGKVASTIRKVAVACLYTMLRKNIAHQKCLYTTGSEVLPLLKVHTMPPAALFCKTSLPPRSAAPFNIDIDPCVRFDIDFHRIHAFLSVVHDIYAHCSFLFLSLVLLCVCVCFFVDDRAPWMITMVALGR